ncbi:MAG TPA: MBL fold metallo-hydrolase [Burkholderiales bacterium]|nr:MBL fold metallo-hydrolase [Burkholderiales bacterium]
MSAYLGRRMFMFGSATFLTQLMLFRRAEAKLLQPGSAVPTVDSLDIKVLMDGSHDIFMKPVGPKSVRIKRARFDDYRRTLHSMWGLSLALESVAGAETRRVILDFGYQPDALLANMELLKVDPAKFDSIILSHGHFDHFGGLVGFLQKHRGVMKRDLTLYAGGEDVFCERKARTAVPDHFSDFGYVDREAISAQQVNIVKCERPTVISDHAFTTGTIQRTSFEKVLPNSMVVSGRIGAMNGCDPALVPGREAGKIVPDQHIHEHATCYNLRGKGLVVITSCGHAGIINTIRQAIEVSGVKKLHALVGGTHLAPADSDYVSRAVAELKTFDPDVVIPMHCSGLNFIEAVRQQMPDRLALSTNGSEFTFGA